MTVKRLGHKENAPTSVTRRGECERPRPLAAGRSACLGAPVRRLCGHLRGRERERIRPASPLPHSPPAQIIVGSDPDVMAEAPSPTCDRRIELPLVLEVAAA